jgi:hypothetical protein
MGTDGVAVRVGGGVLVGGGVCVGSSVDGGCVGDGEAGSVGVSVTGAEVGMLQACMRKARVRMVARTLYFIVSPLLGHFFDLSFPS